MSDTLTITYKLPRSMTADDWLFGCLRDGDYNGVLEWVMNHNLSVEKVELGYANDPHRTPRVVQHLGVNQRDAEWTRKEVSRDTHIWEYRFRHGVWNYRLLGHEKWTAMGPGVEPMNAWFTEVVE